MRCSLIKFSTIEQPYSEQCTMPVVASIEAVKIEHSSGVFEKTETEAALTAGIFHREKVPIEAVKKHMPKKGIVTR